MTMTKNGNQTFKISLDPGECECIIRFLELLLAKLYSHRINKNSKYTEPFDG
jgi:hypothetical protein